MDFESFKQNVDELSLEYEQYYIENNCHPMTCEFSTTSQCLEDKINYLYGKQVVGGRWEMFICETCQSYDIHKKWHVQIDVNHDLEYFHSIVTKYKQETESHRQNIEFWNNKTKNKEYFPRGTLDSLIKDFEVLVENPERYDSYITATMNSDIFQEMIRFVEYSNQYKILHNKLMGE